LITAQRARGARAEGKHNGQTHLSEMNMISAIMTCSDTAAANADRRMELRTKDRLRKLTNQIDKALRRIEDGTYGYCEETGDPIRLKRLDARICVTANRFQRLIRH